MRKAVLDHTQEVEAVEVGHPYVGNHRSDVAIVIEKIQRIAHGDKRGDLVARDLQHRSERIRDVAVVVDDEHRIASGRGIHGSGRVAAGW